MNITGPWYGLRMVGSKEMLQILIKSFFFFFFQAEDGIRDLTVTGVQTCALPILRGAQNGIFYGKGEVCAAGSRLLVEQTVHDQVLEQLAERAKKLVPGDPFDKNKIGRASCRERV